MKDSRDALREARGERFTETQDPPAVSSEDRESGVRISARDTLAVDLCCLGRIVLHRPARAVDTARDFFPSKVR